MLQFFIVCGITLLIFALSRFHRDEKRRFKNIGFKIFAQENGYSYLPKNKSLNKLLARRELIPHSPVRPLHIFSSQLSGKEFKVFDACYLVPGKDEKAIRHFAILIKIEPYSLPRFALRNDSKISTDYFFAFVEGLPKARDYREMLGVENKVVGLYAYRKHETQIEKLLSEQDSILSVFRDEKVQLLIFSKEYCCAYIPGSIKADIEHFLAFERTARKIIEALFSEALKLTKADLNI